MKMFVRDDEVNQLEAELPPVRDGTHLTTLVSLCWALRQRDTARAIELADEAQMLLVASRQPESHLLAMRARLQLVYGEAKWLDADLDAAEELAQGVLNDVDASQDALSRADAHMLLASIFGDRGDAASRETELEKMVESANQVNDALRVHIAKIALARSAALRKLSFIFPDGQSQLNNEQLVSGDASVTVWIADFQGVVAYQSNDYGQAATHFMQMFEMAILTGQIERAITAATNIGNCFTSLNDLHVALEWMQRALNLARQTCWTTCLCLCLTQTAETLRRLGQLKVARKLLKEALDRLSLLKNSRDFAIALKYYGDLALDSADFLLAIETFQQLERQGYAAKQTNFQIDSLRGQAHALLYMERKSEALDAATAALHLAQQQADALRQIEVLRVLADIHSLHPEVSSQDQTPANTTLFFLLQAFDIAKTIDGYTVPGEMLEAIGKEYANLGDFTQAYAMSLQAIAAREKTHSKEATSRSIALQVMYSTERARAEGEYHRQLAASEVQRSKALHQTSTTLEHLSAIGQEITTQLNESAIFQILDRHVHGLLDATSFIIYLVDPDGQGLTSAFRAEAGKILPQRKIPLSSPTAHTARCVRERCEIVINRSTAVDSPSQVPGTLPVLSLLFAPLAIGDRVLGTMTVQSPHANAYGERELLIFRTLCAYGAIALDNANAYRQLQETQKQLVSQEKMAALGSLVAGVAHELNTPIGNSLMFASTMLAKSEEFEHQLGAQGIRRSALLAFVAETKEASEMIIRGLESSANLVHSFKQVAVDRTTAHRRVFDLRQVCQEVVATMMSQIRISGHAVSIDIPNGIILDSYPGPFGQVVTNFISNALVHAFDDRKGGHMSLSAAQMPGCRLLFQFSDDGHGIENKHLSRIFDPFFTTKLGQGGSGLGLSINYNIVTTLLNGEITVSSVPNEGTTFSINMPLT
ncbi:MAG: hypothetical protein NVSMB28_00480 [Collimonas sp.]